MTPPPAPTGPATSGAATRGRTSRQRTAAHLALALLIAAVLAAFLPGQGTVPPLDRDEPRYTQATKQMLETGDFVRIRFQDAPRHKKPVGIHWMQAAAATLSGAGADASLWVYRLPSLLSAAAAVLLTVFMARAFLPPSLALLTGALFGATIILGVEARLAKTDAALLASILLAMGAFARVFAGTARGLWMPTLFWLGLALGILIKGPIAPMVIGLALLVLTLTTERRLILRLRPLLGLAILAVVALPWYVAVYAATDGAFFSAALGRDFLGKAVEGQEGHGAPPLTHLVAFVVVSWPLAPFAVLALRNLWRTRGPVLTFAAAWAIPSWIVFELTPTKLPHYTMPLVPAIALAAVAVLATYEPGRLSRVVAAALLVLVPLGVVVAAPMLILVLNDLFPGAPQLQPDTGRLVAIGALLTLALGAALIGAIRLVRGSPALSLAVTAPVVASAVIAQATVWGAGLPSLQTVWLSSRLVDAAAAAAPCPAPQIISIGYNEPSLVFLAGTGTDLGGIAEALSADGCRVISVRERSEANLRAAAAERGVRLVPAGVVQGFNIAKGDALTLHLFVPREPTPR